MSQIHFPFLTASSLTKSDTTTVEKVGGEGKPTEPEITKDTNASIMKEVITLDKQDEDIDETQTLNSFFNDIQMVTPMEPITEETKYTSLKMRILRNLVKTII